MIAMNQPTDSQVPFWKTPWPWAFFIGVVLLTLIRPLLVHRPDPPPVIGHIEEFSLIDQNGDPFGNTDMDGSITIVNFFFTSCRSICPVLMARTQELEARFTEKGFEGIRFLSISVDPERDTPEAMRSYAEQRDLPLDRWTLLTGDEDSTRHAVMKVFKTPLGAEQEISPGVMDIAHTGKLLLIDEQRNLRGYYDSDEEGLDELYHRTLHVHAGSRR